MQQSLEEKVEVEQRGARREPRMAALLIACVALVVGTAAVIPFYFSRHDVSPETGQSLRLIETHDLENLLPAIQEFDKGLRSGVFYPRWFADINKGYGVATGNFYPPGIFYLASLINYVVGDWVNTLFIISALGLAASGLAMYLLARLFFGRLLSAAAALFYMLAPYHMLDLYWRGAIPEFLGFVFMPLILYFGNRLAVSGRLRYYAAVGLVYGLYLMTHFPVAYLFTYVLALYAVTWACMEKDLKIALRVAGGMAIGMALGAVYLLPAALEGKHAYEWATDYFPYHYVYITLLEKSDPFNVRMDYTFVITVITLVTAIVALRLAKGAGAAADAETAGRADTHTRIWILLGAGALFMCTSLSIYISMLIPRIQVAVPPFRWLAIASVFLTLLVAAAIGRLRAGLHAPVWEQWAYRAAIAGVIALNLWFSVQAVIIRALDNPTDQPVGSKVDSGFTPINSARPEQLTDTPQVVIKPAGGSSEVLRWDPAYREVSVKVDTASVVRLKTYNFPGWTAVVNGQPAPLLSDSEGVQVIAVQPGAHKIQVSFKNTPPRTAGALVSGASLLVIIGLSAFDYLRRGKRLASHV